jgi:hypothetical protein
MTRAKLTDVRTASCPQCRSARARRRMVLKFREFFCSGTKNAQMLAVLFAALLCGVSAVVPFRSTNRMFGHSIKNGPLAPATEQTAFEHACATPPCTVTQVHVPSIYPQHGDPWNWEEGRLRFYVDNETVPSVDIRLRELASIGKRDAVGDAASVGPFGLPLFGKTAKSGGAYSTMRIPFGVSLKVTIENAPTATSEGIYWFIIRGVEALPVTLGGELALPDQARLHVARNTALTVAPQTLITLAAVPAGTAGALVNVFLDNNSTDPNYLEACVRFTADGAAAPQFLSSGTEVRPQPRPAGRRARGAPLTIAPAALNRPRRTTS